MLRSFPTAAALCTLHWALCGCLPLCLSRQNPRRTGPRWYRLRNKELSPPTALQPIETIVSPLRRLLTTRRKPCLSEPNRVSRESLLASHQTSMRLVASRILVSLDQHRVDEWMPQQFHKGLRVGVLFEKRRLLLRTSSTVRRLPGQPMIDAL